MLDGSDIKVMLCNELDWGCLRSAKMNVWI
jgi:hypothetical protein